MRNGQVSRQRQLRDLLLTAADGALFLRQDTFEPKRAWMMRGDERVLVDAKTHRKIRKGPALHVCGHPVENLS